MTEHQGLAEDHLDVQWPGAEVLLPLLLLRFLYLSRPLWK